MEDLAVIVSVMLFGAALLGVVSIVLGVMSRNRPQLRPFAWALVLGTVGVGSWFATFSWPLAAIPLVGGLIGLVLLTAPLLQKR